MNVRAVVVYVTAAILASALVIRFYRLGGAYLSPPETIYDHVTPAGHDTVNAILLARRAAPLLPRGATVTMFRPSAAPDDTTHFHTAVGLLPYQRVVARTRQPQFVLTVREPLNDPGYELLASFAEGNVYKRR